MRFKDYIDKKYHFYDDADKSFYNTLTRKKNLRETEKKLKKLGYGRIEEMHENCKKQIPSYRPT